MAEKDLTESLRLKTEAGVPIIQLISNEFQRTLGHVIGSAKRNGASNKPVFVWNATEGLKRWKYDEYSFEEEKKSVTNPLDVLDWFLSTNCDDDSILLMEDLHLYFDDEGIRRSLISQLRIIGKGHMAERNKNLILYQPMRSLPPELDKDVYIMDVPLPSKRVLSQILETTVEKHLGEEYRIDDDTKSQLAEAAKGLTHLEADHAFAEVSINKKKMTLDEIPDIIAEKEQIIKKGGILEYFHPTEGLNDIGGMDNLIKWLKRRRLGLEPGAQDFGLTAPKGLLMVGVQGCGKSLMAKAISSEWNLPLLRFDIGRVFGSLQGQSEANIRSALETAKAVAPCILWIDEIEKALSGVSSSDQTDGGTTARVFGTLLTWMQEKKEPVFVVSTANNIHALPPELLRKGRFDEIFFVDLPGKLSRKEIWKIHLLRRMGKQRFENGQFDLDVLSEVSLGFSGAEIEEAVNEGLYIARAEERDLIMDDLKRALDETVPISRVMNQGIEFLRDWAKQRAQPASNEPVEDISGKQARLTKTEKAFYNPENLI